MATTLTDPVIWRECEGCGQPWPFPLGPRIPGYLQNRDWICVVCCNAKLAEIMRKYGIQVA